MGISGDTQKVRKSMKSVFEKIIEKLEEIRVKKTCNKEKCDTKEICRICVVDDAIEIVKQEAKQYNNAIIDGKYCFQSCACTEKCDKCSRLCNGYIDWYENIDNWTEEYNNGWILCSEQLPDYGESVLVSFNQARQPLIATFYENDTWKMLQGVNGLIDITNEVIAWQPLPQPYQQNGE